MTKLAKWLLAILRYINTQKRLANGQPLLLFLALDWN